MRLLIVRHADAGDAEEFAKTGQPDSMRPLSRKGRKQMRRAARALAELVPDVEIVVASPFTRAVQTQALLVEGFGSRIPTQLTDTLEPDRPPGDFAGWLRGTDQRGTLAVVGHEPHLSTLATWLMTGETESRIQIKKGGACLLDLDGDARNATATLRWLLTPKQLDLLTPAE
jgi:phosphohistidine phosphatase